MEQMLAGELYRFGDGEHPELREAWERSKAACARFNQEGPFKGSGGRNAILTGMLGSVGKEADITPPFSCAFGFNTHLGEGVFFNFNCVVLDVVRVDIGDHTTIGPAVQIYTVEHPKLRLEKWESGRQVKIGKNVWVGGGAIILPSVTIGDNAIVGAGAVVTRDVADGSTVAGVPAKPIKKQK